MEPMDVADLAIRLYRESAPTDVPKIEFWGLLQRAIAEAVQEYQRKSEAAPKLLEALKYIAQLGGNLPDDSLTDRTGPNDAAHRGLMYCQAREVARAAIAEARGGKG